jgi:hypothetical protein
MIGGKRVNLIDLPGWDSAITAHRKITTDAIEMSDGCLLVKSGADNASLTGPSIELAEKLNTIKTMVAITKLDQCTDDMSKSNFEKLCDAFRNKGIRGEIFPTYPLYPFIKMKNTKNVPKLTTDPDVNELEKRIQNKPLLNSRMFIYIAVIFVCFAYFFNLFIRRWHYSPQKFYSSIFGSRNSNHPRQGDSPLN